MKIEYDKVQDIYQPQPNPIKKGDSRYFCLECKKTLDEKQYFKTNRLDKFAAGILPVCKNCVTMGVIDTDPSTFLPFLKELDLPYHPIEWRALVAKKSPKAKSILGKYVSKMKLRQFNKYRWADTQSLVDSESRSLLEALRQESGTESEAEDKLSEMMSMQDLGPSTSISTDIQNNISAMYGLTPETSKFNLSQNQIDDLKLTWGEDYTEDQFFQLEQLFNEMKDAYVITDPIAISNAKIICKMTTKMNRFLDIDDVESASKLSRQLDLFVKTANLAPIQQKDRQQTTYSIAQLAFLVEKEGGFVPDFYTDEVNDNIDALLEDMKKYTFDLVKGETNLPELIENTLQVLENEDVETDEVDFDQFAEFEEEVMGGLVEIEGDEDNDEGGE